jgi:hypothetical protein
MICEAARTKFKLETRLSLWSLMFNNCCTDLKSDEILPKSWLHVASMHDPWVLNPCCFQFMLDSTLLAWPLMLIPCCLQALAKLRVSTLLLSPSCQHDLWGMLQCLLLALTCYSANTNRGWVNVIDMILVLQKHDQEKEGAKQYGLVLSSSSKKDSKVRSLTIYLK